MATVINVLVGIVLVAVTIFIFSKVNETKSVSRPNTYSRPMYKAGPNWSSLLGYLIVVIIFGALLVIGGSVWDVYIDSPK